MISARTYIQGSKNAAPVSNPQIAISGLELAGSRPAVIQTRRGEFWRHILASPSETRLRKQASRSAKLPHVVAFSSDKQKPRETTALVLGTAFPPRRALAKTVLTASIRAVPPWLSIFNHLAHTNETQLLLFPKDAL
jgi:hypothetical protein